MSDSPFHLLNDETKWSEALSRSAERPVLVFKHSAACPVSARAEGEMQKLAEESDLPIYKVVVQNNRAVSDQIASDLEIRHETPQVILLNKKRPVYETSHSDVTADTLRKAVDSLNPSP